MSAKDALDALLQQQEALPRGPRREGTFAVWLLARVALDVGRASADADRAERRRLALLERRLAPLAVPRPLARGLTTALTHLGEGTPRSARVALSQLVAPVHESLGPGAGEAVAMMARELHDLQQGGSA